MTICKLILEEERGFRYNPTNTTYHINSTVAKAYADKKIKEGFTETVDCGEYGKVERRVDYSKNYKIETITVNEEIYL